MVICHRGACFLSLVVATAYARFARLGTARPATALQEIGSLTIASSGLEGHTHQAPLGIAEAQLGLHDRARLADADAVDVEYVGHRAQIAHNAVAHAGGAAL